VRAFTIGGTGLVGGADLLVDCACFTAGGPFPPRLHRDCRRRGHPSKAARKTAPPSSVRSSITMSPRRGKRLGTAKELGNGQLPVLVVAGWEG
jgi:hypothetical protein